MAAEIYWTELKLRQAEKMLTMAEHKLNVAETGARSSKETTVARR